jgi:hypothetical protein
MAFQDSSPDLLNRLIVNKTIKNELCTCLNILYNVNDNHPRIEILRQNEAKFHVTCPAIRFCKFIKNKLAKLQMTEGTISSQEIPELKNRKTYFVIGLTGDSVDENNQKVNGEWRGQYWPLFVSVLTVPNYVDED